MRALLSLVILMLFSSCKNNDAAYTELSSIFSEENAFEAQKLAETHCYLCHNPKDDIESNRIAPSFVEIKAFYDLNSSSREAFILDFIDFVEKPEVSKSKMPEAVKKHGLMPAQAFPKGVVEKIAIYVYDFKIDEPKDFNNYSKGKLNHWQQRGKTLGLVNSTKSFEELGLEMALGTKAVLGKNLMGAIQSKGTLAALEFCNIQAIPLTDSMSLHYQAHIKRVSDKNRNPSNKANVEELKYIAHFKEVVAAQQEPKPVVLEKGNTVQFYYPITTNTMCLQCHGKQVTEEVRLQTLKLYPRDLAVGYGENEVRGIWSIQFEKQ